ncbi:carbohydrate kinase family protein [Nocardioides cavernaquae]|uniref:Carbohydrate kinase n=1 Tax=Nocardioides cavernaquae TaxID=2321396 RepID=A0A3A5HFF7_9ACTN|nr:carbohydrate kinase [Nocardioides cavernaquae]RJS46710.1 carbohydrate kinase [Nocardioides cavernaquae]
MTNSSALVIGEALIDLIQRSRLPAIARVGGSPLNVAIGLSRLGMRVDLQTQIGADHHGTLIEQHLAADGVALVAGSVSEQPTSTAVATIGDDGSATYEFDISWALSAADGLMPTVAHTGSIAAVVEPGASAVRNAIRALRATATVSYDPNVRPQLMGDRSDACRRIESLVALADVVKVSSEDLAWLHPDVEPSAVARRWVGLGAALVVITDGESGATALTQYVTVEVPARRTDVVDTIGAGDSFMAGLLAALDDAGLLGRNNEVRLRAIDASVLRDVLAFAAECAAITVSRPGADPPRRSEVPQARRA